MPGSQIRRVNVFTWPEFRAFPCKQRISAPIRHRNGRDNRDRDDGPGTSETNVLDARKSVFAPLILPLWARIPCPLARQARLSRTLRIRNDGLKKDRPG